MRTCVCCGEAIPEKGRAKYCSNWCRTRKSLDASEANIEVNLRNDETYGLSAPDIRRVQITN